MMTIDAHQHYWMLSRGDYGWLTPEVGRIYRDFMPSDLRPKLESCAISKTIVVQAAPTTEETEFLLQLADNEESIAGVVGWLDFESRSFDEQLVRLRKHQKFVGLRPMLQDLPEDDWILKEQVLENISVLVQEEIPLDILVFPRHLPYIVELLRKFPTLRAVVDHLAKPNIKEHVFEPWRKHLAQVAEYPKVMCKLSGMVTEADYLNWQPADFQPYVEHVLTTFGPDRVMFGSDYPVCTLAADYETVYRTLKDLLIELTEPQLARVFGGNAAAFYKLV